MIHDLNPYPAYKDSGIEWLGEVPEHWEVKRNKLFLHEVKERSEDGSEELLTVSQYTGVTLRRDRLSEEGELLTNAASLVDYKRVSPGDLVINIMLAWNGSLGVSPFEGITSPAYCVYRAIADIEPRFLHYLLRTPLFTEVFKTVSTGVVDSRLRLYPDVFFRLPSLLPPKAEQSAIVRYLDYINKQIRRYIHAKQKLIKLLEEEKQAIIHRAVTRGLDPDVRFRPSETKWLGDVPEHWKITKLYRITDPHRPIMYGIVLPGLNVDEGVFIVKGGNCEPGRLRAEYLSRTTFEIESKYSRSRLKKNDIVYAIRGSIGAAELVPIELTGANLTQDAARIAPCVGILPKWLLYFVQSQVFFSKLDSEAVGATIRGINIRDLKRADVVVPPINEQLLIAEYLEAENERFSLVIGRTLQEISLLQEYRTRLIADVVTGKLDVRKAVANLPDKKEALNIHNLSEDFCDFTTLENELLEDEISEY